MPVFDQLPDFDDHQDDYHPGGDVYVSPTQASIGMATGRQNTSTLTDTRRTLHINAHRRLHNPSVKTKLYNVGAKNFRNIECKRYPMAHLWGTNQNNTVNHQVATLIERYHMTETTAVPDHMVDAQAELYWNGLMQFFDPDKIRSPTPQELSACMTNAAMKVQMKQSYPDTVSVADASASLDRKTTFNKTQIKSGYKADPWLPIDNSGATPAIKGGQMVNGLPKHLNEIVAAWVNWTTRTLERSARDNFMPVTSIPDRELKRWVKAKYAAHRGNKAHYYHINIDIKAQDTSWDKATMAVVRRFFKACGWPDDVLELWCESQQNWRMKTKDYAANVLINGPSGVNGTLTKNIVQACSAIGSTYILDDPVYVLQKGDDFCALVRGAQLTNNPFRNLKVEKSVVGSFTSFLIVGGALTLDTLRVAARLLTKSDNDNERHEQLRQSVVDRLALLRNYQERYLCNVVNAVYHSIEGHVAHDVYCYLRSFANTETSERPEMTRNDKKRGTSYFTGYDIPQLVEGSMHDYIDW